ncbi:MAG: Hcp family type VI secretion system effector [Rhodospirillales bacterium]
MAGIYLKFGDVKGDATEDGHKDWIQCNSCQWGVGRGIATPVGNAKTRDVSHPSVSEVVLTKELDSSSVGLFQAAVGAMDAVKVKIDFVRTDKNKAEVYLTYELENALVSGYSVSSGGDKPNESLSLNFTKITLNHQAGNVKNDAASKAVAGYDLALAKTQ